MINFYVKNDIIYLNFSGENFTEILAACQKIHLKYDPEMRSWTGDNKQLNTIINKLSYIEEFKVDDKILEEIQPKKRVEFLRRKFNKELMLANPLGDYQIEDIKKMLSTNGIINGSEVGLGKTLETITVINHLYQNKEIDRILIVSFAQAIYNWKREILKFSNFFKEEDILVANKDSRNILENLDKKIIILSYNTLILADKYYSKLLNKKHSKKSRKTNLEFDKWGTKRCIILDESHAIKSDSLRTKECLLIKDFYDFRYLLSGTPYPNNVAELYHQLNFIDESIIYADYSSFLSSIANVGNRFSRYAVNYFYPDKVENFVKTIEPYIFRRYKKEALPNLPPQYIKKIYLPINDKQEKIYELIISEKLQRLKEEKGEIFVRDVKNSFPYLTLACSDPSILKNKLINSDENSYYNIIFEKDIKKCLENWKFEHNSKLEALEGILEEYEDEKIIIWSEHPQTIECLKDYFIKKNPIIIYGESHKKSGEDKEIHRDRLLNEFKTNKNRNIIIMNPQIMGTAINIQEARISVFFDRNYDVKTYLQALGRNHRGNSERDVIVYVLILEDTLEIEQDNILDQKEDLNNYLMEYDTLPKEKWQKIFKGK